MTDILVVPDLGQSAKIWGQVWGHLTAPVQHPPQLRVATGVGKVSIFAPSSGSNGGTPRPKVQTLDSLAQDVADTVVNDGLRNLVVVAHGASAALLLHSVPKLSAPPKRVVMFGGIVPWEGESILGSLPMTANPVFKGLALVHRLTKRELRPPKPYIFRYLCNGMDPMEVFRHVHMFGPLPMKALRGRASLRGFTQATPVTYVVLERDLSLPPRFQRDMAQRLPNTEVLSLNTSHQAMLESPQDVADVILRYS